MALPASRRAKLANWTRASAIRTSRLATEQQSFVSVLAAIAIRPGRIRGGWFCAMVLCAVLRASAVGAHGEAAWIMTDPKTAYCCGPHDCERAPVGAVKSSGNGWLVVSTGQVFHEEDPDFHWSVDQSYWWCRPNGPPWNGARVKCLFAPPGGV